MKPKLIRALLLALALLLAPTAPARADYAADYKLLKQFEPVITANDVAGARKLIAAPNFRPLIRYGPAYDTVFERALRLDRVAMARAMMASPGWKATRWTVKNTSIPLVLASGSPLLFPILQELARQPGFDLSKARNFQNESLTATAAQMDNLPALKWLIRQPGLKVTNRDSDGWTLLFVSNIAATKYLLSLHRIDVNARDKYGQTALHVVCGGFSTTDKIKLLLAARGIDTRIKDNNGETPFDASLRADDITSWDKARSDFLLTQPKMKLTPEERHSYDLMRDAKDDYDDLPNKTYAG